MPVGEILELLGLLEQHFWANENGRLSGGLTALRSSHISSCAQSLHLAFLPHCNASHQEHASTPSAQQQLFLSLIA